MRLINTTTLSLEEFIGDNIPRYAILSHRWENDEVLYQDMSSQSRTSKRGWSKIQGCCQQALADGWPYVWVDSCCIDKASSAELSEAINSMFQWYSKAAICYVYLCDVPVATQQSAEELEYLRNSEWFTRGWTLQELLAPPHVIFFDQGWNDIGTRRSLRSVLITITRINCIDEKSTFKSASVAQKFSWAARRKTTREEDKSYSLMGLLSINMPILYGEGQRAFMRFQEEVLRTSADESIFAWAPEWYQQYAITSLLAPSIAHFDTCGNIITKKLPTEFNRREPYAMTNKGLRMEHRILCDRDSFDRTRQQSTSCQVILACAKEDWSTILTQSSYIAIDIVVDPDWVHAHRVLSSTLSRNVLNVVSMTTIKPDQILVKPLFFENDAIVDNSNLFHQHSFLPGKYWLASEYPWNVINIQPVTDHGYELDEIWKKHLDMTEARCLHELPHRDEFGTVFYNLLLIFRHQSSNDSFAIILFRFEELVAVADIVELNSLENESYVMGLVEISSPEKVPKRAQDRKSRRLVNGDIVTVSIRLKFIDNMTFWGVDIKMIPVKSHEMCGFGADPELLMHL
ncbi:hypothetical protein GLAREA_05190 [Glarea lozoyensis ATCC 20868]|uniref:Heterokaryon incompatibility domain-containing protein n=1 Tax=Glarea lozoyensis (strain ATCC 20868 / MF5171) TaxID=1116229 RepID=S3DBQ3_GLAL2|nr:uncharacterized protein GLAREA_05190 [Glarea lozoyensis ATCC 20868]EPE35852.1 hypothetical protein GLAREA_05190 [Glarea lozoyensis ATCC 20868]